MLKTKITKLLSLCLALFMLVSAFTPAVVNAENTGIKEKTKTYNINTYLFYDMGEENFPPYTADAWRNSEGYQMPLVFTNEYAGNDTKDLEFEAFRVGSPNGLVTYCLELGKDAPEGKSLSYDEEKLGVKLLRVIKKGYPNASMADYGLENEAAFEWATAVALKMTEGHAYVGTEGRQISTPLTKANFDKILKPRYVAEDYILAYLKAHANKNYATIKANQAMVAARDAGKTAAEQQAAADAAKAEAQQKLVDDYEGVLEELRAMPAIMTDIQNRMQNNGDNEKVAYWAAEAAKMKEVIFRLYDYGNDESIVVDDLSITEHPEDATVYSNNPTFIYGPFKAVLTSNDAAELAVKAEVVKNNASTELTIDTVNESGQHITPEFNEPFYIKGTVNETSRLRVSAYAVGLNVPAQVTYSTTEKGSHGFPIQKMYVADTVTLNDSVYGNIKVVPVYDVELSKTDLVDGKPVQCATIEVYNSKNAQVAGSPFVTDSNGKIRVKNLAPGNYTFKETVAPDGYIINTALSSFTVNEDGTVSGVQSITNEPNKVTITKTDSTTNAPVENAEITFYDSEGEKYATKTTDEDGKIILDKVPVGTYTFKETKAPDGYVLNTQTAHFSIDEAGNVTGTTSLKNTPTRVVITKTDMVDGEPVPGATIEIMNSQGTVVKTMVTGEDGTIVVEKLPVGTYTFHETIAPAGYILSDETATFTINEDGSVTGKTEIQNAPNTAVITKTDMVSGEPVPGATIEIINNTSETIVFSGVTDKNGEISLSKLTPGEYTFREVLAPSGYIISDEEGTFTVNRDGTITGKTILRNQPTEVIFHKVDADDEETSLNGAEIEVRDEAGNTIRFGVTDENGETKFYGLPKGVYTAHEVKAPSGYVLSSELIKFTIDESGKVMWNDGESEGNLFVLKNKKSEVVITKTDAVNGKLVPGAKIQILNENKEVVYEGTTGTRGTIRAFALPDGKYTFKEVLPPAGYILSEEEGEFTIKDGVVTGKTTMTNEPVVVEITKKDSASNKALNNVVFEVTNPNGQVETKTTDNEGKIIIQYAVPGIYRYKETKTQEGYKLSDTEYQFEVSDKGEVSGTLEIMNEKISVTLYKKDADTQELLPGATFVVKDSNGNEIISATTNANGEITVNKIVPGTYTVQETIAPDGYELNSTVYSFEIDKYGKIDGTTTIFDKKSNDSVEKSTPDEVNKEKTQTGDNRNSNIYRILLLLIATSLLGTVVFVGIKNRRKER